MKVHVIRPFAYSRDGITALQAAAGDVVDVPDRLVDGLVAGGWCRPADAAPTAPAPRAAGRRAKRP